MDAILTILRAAHCRSTHHYFAIDALSKVSTQQGSKLAKLLLKYHDDYLLGAKAPDTTFRDFQNHVLHVSQDNWGGAPRKCEEWLGKLVKSLDRREWAKAAYACGVLSHYFTDPLMPLHTGQSEKETVVHRPMEWSICKSYDAIYTAAKGSASEQLEIAKSEQWISDTVISGASIAHRYYDRLIDIYDLERGCKKPPEGLNAESREMLGHLFHLAIHGWGKVLDRIAYETETEIPAVSLHLSTVLAAIDLPMAWVVQKISNVNEQIAVKKILKEYKATGTLRKNLPVESQVVSKQLARHQKTLKRRAKRESGTGPIRAALQRVKLTRSQDVASQNDRLNLGSDIVDAPSIGPKTAKRFYAIGVCTVAEFLAVAPESLAKELNTRWIKDATIQDWQHQARLVCEVSALCGYKSQLLVAAGCRRADDLAAAEAGSLHKQVLLVAKGREGKRILRSSKPPSLEDVQEWIASASSRASKEAA